MVNKIINHGSVDSIVSEVSIWKRLMALIIDILIIMTLFLVISLNLSSNPFYSNLNYIAVTLLFFGYALWDFWYFPNKTGYTLSRWIMGYKIQTTNNTLPGIKKLFIRWATLFIVHILSINILSLIAIVFRKDGRAIHDIASGTVTTNQDVDYKWFRSFFLLSILCVFSLVTYNSLIRYCYYTFVFPKKASLYHDPNFEVSHLPDIRKIDNENSLRISDSPFYLKEIDDSSNIEIDSNRIVFNDKNYSFEFKKKREYFIGFDSEMQSLSSLGIVNESWDSDNLFWMYYGSYLNQFDRNVKIFRPIQSFVFIISNIYGAINDNKDNEVLRKVYLLSDVPGFYTIREKGIYLDVTYQNHTYSMRINMSERDMEFEEYLFDNMSFFKRDNR